MRPADLPSLRERARDPAIRPFYRELKRRMDSAGKPHSNAEVAGFEMQSLALLHLVERGDPRYRRKLVERWLWRSYSPGDVGHWALPYQVIGHAIALDWLWNELSPALRRDFARTLVAMMDDLYGYGEHDIGADPPYANQMSDYSNQLYYHRAALAFAGIVLAGEGINDSRAQFYLSRAEDLLNNHMIPATNQEAGGDADLGRTSGFVGNGGWGEDVSHIAMTHPMLGRMLAAWASGTGEDLFPRANGLRRIGQYMVYLLRPGGAFAPKGHARYGMRPGDKNYGMVGALASGRYGDPYGKYLKDRAHEESSWGFHQVASVLWYDASLSPLEETGMPSSVHFQGQGEVVARSGLGPRDTWVYLRSGPIYNGHQDDDQGNLLVEAHGGELLVEDAGPDKDATRHHNTLLIGGDGQIPYGGNELQYVQPIAGTPQERGRITRYERREHYTYAAADLGTAYADDRVAPPKAGRVTREVVVVLPDIVVVRDRVDARAIPEFRLHARSGAATPGGGRTVGIAHGDGFAQVRTLLPRDGRVAVERGGDTDRISVVPGNGAGRTTFLHLVLLSPRDAAYRPDDVVLVDAGGAQGVAFTDRGGRRWRVVFAADRVGLVGVDRAPGGGG